VTGPASEATAYPVLDGGQQARLRRYGTTRAVEAGEVLFSPADDSYDLFVVLSGEIIVSNDLPGRSGEFARHGPGQFAGELNLLTGQRPFHTAHATTEGSVLAVTPVRIREVLARETDIADILLRTLIARRRQRVSGAAPGPAIEIIGTGQSGAALALRTFLNRNTIAYRWVDVDQADVAADILLSVGATRADLPVAITPTRVLMNADPADVAALLGHGGYPDDLRRYDVVVVGAGPAGLSAAVYGASEGLDVAVLDAIAPGGQAGASSRIENYLGFPQGISGAELTTRATIQAQRFGALLASPCCVDRVAVAGGTFTVGLADGTSVAAQAVVAASGALYRRLPLPNWQRLEGSGIYYAATDLEAGLSSASHVIVLGGGNSAGQAALYLARRGARVTIVVRRGSLAASMSQYLTDRLTGSDRIDVATSTEVAAVDGGDHLDSIALRDTATGAVTQVPSSGLFCFIGAHPASAWLPAEVACDEDGFVLTDVAVPAGPASPRTRLPFETTVDGMFAAGDIRAGSVKRVAAAVGEGSSVIRSVHQYLTRLSVGAPVGVPPRLLPRPSPRQRRGCPCPQCGSAHPCRARRSSWPSATATRLTWKRPTWRGPPARPGSTSSRPASSGPATRSGSPRSPRTKSTTRASSAW
jgi:thioredoxin reductase (NADPH)